jgi:hypothetical protein
LSAENNPAIPLPIIAMSDMVSKLTEMLLPFQLFER